MDNKFKTAVVNLESLSELDFIIPTYQRPFVWGDEQLKKLLDDFYLSFQNNPDSVYYVSTFLTKEEEGVAELIDGQQRFTTLWLISLVISKLTPNSDIINFLKKKDKLRLGFEIRTEVGDFLESLLEDDTYRKIQDSERIIKQPYLKNIAKALVFIDGYIKQKVPQNRLDQFGDYIYRKVELVKNTTPQKIDLNKLFSTINSSGVQLEQTDIVKANLLNLIDEKVMYGKIWETCENMSNFFERNARTSFPESNWSSINLNEYLAFDPNTFKYKADESDLSTDSDSFRLDDIDINDLEAYRHPERKYKNEVGRESEEIYCRSIINFGQFLLHVYRLHLHKEGFDDFKGTFHVNRLIEIFTELENRNNSDEIKRFFKLMWDARYLFDKYIIKFVTDLDTKNESLELVNFNRNEKSYYSRSRFEKSNSLMLQSVLYFTGDYLRQYWITTYLAYLLNNHSNSLATEVKHLRYLEKIDNIFSLVNSRTDKELSWDLLETDSNIKPDIDTERELIKDHGTKFKHYWFQKLEYILWKNWEFDKTKEFLNYRIISRNSVEHIYPQNPENRNQHPAIEGEALHSFGNLVLLSVSQNSEYSNKSVNVKRSMFKEKKDTYDTLKSFYIFQKDKWSPVEIKKHREEMISKIKEHYNHA